MADTLKYCKVRKVKDPTRGTAVAAGIDFYIPSDIDVDDFTSKCEVTKSYPNYRLNDEYFIDAIDLRPGESVMIPSGIKMKVPSGYALVMMNKSGIGAKKQLDVLACVIDQDYEGEVHLNLINVGCNTQTINAGDKIVQGVVLPINYCMTEEVASATELYSDSNSERGEGGFGSTGTK